MSGDASEEKGYINSILVIYGNICTCAGAELYCATPVSFVTCWVSTTAIWGKVCIASLPWTRRCTCVYLANIYVLTYIVLS